MGMLIQVSTGLSEGMVSPVIEDFLGSETAIDIWVGVGKGVSVSAGVGEAADWVAGIFVEEAVGVGVVAITASPAVGVAAVSPSGGVVTDDSVGVVFFGKLQDDEINITRSRITRVNTANLSFKVNLHKNKSQIEYCFRTNSYCNANFRVT